MFVRSRLSDLYFLLDLSVVLTNVSSISKKEVPSLDDKVSQLKLIGKEKKKTSGD